MPERPVTGRLVRIDASEYAGARGLKHLFLAGDLRKPAPHPFVRDDRLELILCFYEPGDDGLYHWHPDVTEYELVLEGSISYFEVGTGETHRFEAGDFCVIPPGVCVRRIVREPARTVAVKAPSTDDKIHCAGCGRPCACRIEPFVGSE